PGPGHPPAPGPPPSPAVSSRIPPRAPALAGLSARPRGGQAGTYLRDKVTRLVRPSGRPRVSGASERAGRGAVRRPPLLLRSQALSSSALPSAPLLSPRPALAASAPGCPARRARGTGGSPAAESLELRRRGGAQSSRPPGGEGVRGDSRRARRAGRLGKGRPRESRSTSLARLRTR
ncbi:hypothetical protein P7K49_009195, partial [Saguinus oedipus]